MDGFSVFVVVVAGAIFADFFPRDVLFIDGEKFVTSDASVTGCFPAFDNVGDGISVFPWPVTF